MSARPSTVVQADKPLVKVINKDTIERHPWMFCSFCITDFADVAMRLCWICSRYCLYIIVLKYVLPVPDRCFLGGVCFMLWSYMSYSVMLKVLSQPKITCSKLTIETLEKGVARVFIVNFERISHWCLYVNFEHISYIVTVFLLLTLSM